MQLRGDIPAERSFFDRRQDRLLPAPGELLERDRRRGPVVDVVYFSEVRLEGPKRNLLAGELFLRPENNGLVNSLAALADALDPD